MSIESSKIGWRVDRIDFEHSYCRDSTLLPATFNRVIYRWFTVVFAMLRRQRNFANLSDVACWPFSCGCRHVAHVLNVDTRDCLQPDVDHERCGSQLTLIQYT